jgi:antitoxin (DNA-binding transcriptional repressor) of toxin-antitoxin stability system
MAVSPEGTESPIVQVGDDDALVFAMRELNQQTAHTIKEIERTGKPAIITSHGRFIALITPLAPGQLERRVLPVAARQAVKRPPAGTESPIVQVGDDDARVVTMRELNQQTARIMSEIEEEGRPAVLTRHARFVALITPLAPGQVVSRILPVAARQAVKRDQG